MAEAKARIKINKLLEEAGWRFFSENGNPANIILENNTKITTQLLDEYGKNFEKTSSGFIDYLLLDDKGFPFIVVEAKKEEINPLVAKDQARKYAKAQKCRFIILTNGNEHYLWDLERGNPNPITKFPSPDTANEFSAFVPDKQALINAEINNDYLVLTQKPDYKNAPQWNDENLKPSFIEQNKLCFLRKYQLNAVKRIQEEVKEGKDRFLFEMATGTGKTATSAAVIKLFLKTENAKRVLFLVDRLELEDQAKKAFVKYLKNDLTCVIFKENRDDWRKAEIVVSTIQSFTTNNKYKRIFSPTDFDLVISDEAHRSIGGNGRAVFEYFIGYKLGLTATPKDYLKKIDSQKLGANDPRELERRMLLDTYITFGCANGSPTFRYSLLDGVKDGFLINPVVVDARTEITTQLLSDDGYSVMVENDEHQEEEQSFYLRDFERKFFSETTNKIFCKTFLENAFHDPVSEEIGKTIVFAVSQNHAAKITQILNVMAETLYPGKYQSDFAVQVTSQIPDAQQYSINFANNNLNGSANFNEQYKTSKTRVCVTVGMMTTGYDCEDLLNICLMRPIFSPTDFIQIKGRGTRKYNFLKDLFNVEMKSHVLRPDKTKFKLFDFFANCEYFEEKFNYDEVLKLPALRKAPNEDGGVDYVTPEDFANINPDPLKTMRVSDIGEQGMKIDRMYFNRFEDRVKEDKTISELLVQQQFDKIEDYIYSKLFNKPEDYYNLEKLQKAAQIDRPLSLREIIEKIFGYIPYFKSKDELLEEEFEKFDNTYLPDEDNFSSAKNFFKSYITDEEFREIVESKDFALLNTNPNGEVFRKLPAELRTLIPEYIKENISLNKFTS